MQYSTVLNLRKTVRTFFSVCSKSTPYEPISSFVVEPLKILVRAPRGEIGHRRRVLFRLTLPVPSDDTRSNILRQTTTVGGANIARGVHRRQSIPVLELRKSAAPTELLQVPKSPPRIHSFACLLFKLLTSHFTHPEGHFNFTSGTDARPSRTLSAVGRFTLATPKLTVLGQRSQEASSPAYSIHSLSRVSKSSTGLLRVPKSLITNPSLVHVWSGATYVRPVRDGNCTWVTHHPCPAPAVSPSMCRRAIRYAIH